jgi:Methane oxygenase PmoA
MSISLFASIGALCLGAIEVNLAPEATDRSGLPCFLPAQPSWNLQSGQTGSLTDHSGKIWASWQAIPARLSSSENKQSLEIVFVPSVFPAGKLQKLLLELGKTPASPLVWDTDSKGMARLSHNKKPLAVYYAPKYDASNNKTLEATYKVFHHLYDPVTGTQLTKGPGGQFTHHRGIFYGFMKVTYGSNQVVDIWHCKNETHQSALKVLLQEGGPVAGLQRMTIGWHGEKGLLFAEETRELVFIPTPNGTWIEFSSSVRPTEGTMKVDGDPQHAGFHFRAAGEVADKNSAETYFLRPDGKDIPKATRNWPNQKNHVNLPWNCMSFVTNGSRYTTEYMDSPTNPKESRYSERDYGRLGSYFVSTAAADKPLNVRYGLFVQSGETTVIEASRRAVAFVTPINSNNGGR